MGKRARPTKGGVIVANQSTTETKVCGKDMARVLADPKQPFNPQDYNPEDPEFGICLCRVLNRFGRFSKSRQEVVRNRIVMVTCVPFEKIRQAYNG